MILLLHSVIPKGFPFGVFGGFRAWSSWGFFFGVFFFFWCWLWLLVYTPGVLRGALRFLINLVTYQKKIIENATAP
jgi:hypothetical protein